MVPGVYKPLYMPLSQVLFTHVPPWVMSLVVHMADYRAGCVHRLVAEMTLLVGTSTRVGIPIEESGLLPLRNNHLPEEKQAQNGQQSRYRESHILRNVKTSQPLRNCSQTPLKVKPRLLTTER